MTYEAFVYIWFDTKKRMFYIGSHKGTIDDKYVCSSKILMNAYRLRPETFKRRILKFCNKNDVFKWEQHYLDMIKFNELYYQSRKYYNIKCFATGGDVTSCLPNKAAIIKKRYGKKHSDAVRAAIQRRSPERKRLHIERVKASCRKTYDSPSFTNYQDKPFQLYVNGVLYGTYRNKTVFIKEIPCTPEKVLEGVKTGQWIIKQKRRHPFKVGDVLDFVLI
jgi:hypothetical protein